MKKRTKGFFSSWWGGGCKGGVQGIRGPRSLSREKKYIGANEEKDIVKVEGGTGKIFGKA